MMGALKEIDWTEFEDAVPAFFAAVFMSFCYSISYGIAAGFIFYCIVKYCRGKAKDVHPILLISALLFLLSFVFMAFI
jgi:AGZA family xanthine/uracil permease-like MFS transporter